MSKKNYKRQYREPEIPPNHSLDATPRGLASRAGMIITQEDREHVTRLMQEVIREFHNEPVKDDAELMERLSDYFERAMKNGQVPTVEEMSLATGRSSSWVSQVRSGHCKGFSTETAQILDRAVEFMKTIDAKLAVSGKLNFLVYCFRAKNFYGMTDKVEHIITPNMQESIDYSAEDLARKYGIDVTETDSGLLAEE